MNTSTLSGLTKLPMRLWRHFQYWRAMRMYARVRRLLEEARLLTAKADRLIGTNVKPPMPLFDRMDGEGR